MKLGIKVGPRQQSLKDLDETNAKFCEVWFDINRLDEYDELFDGIQARGIEAGLHFWGALPDGTWTTMAYDDQETTDRSYALIRDTIDVAAARKFQYVNIHPGTRALVHIDLSAHTIAPKSDPIPQKRAISQFVHYAKKLHTYAAAKNVVFTVETVPPRVYSHWDNPANRLHPINAYELDTKAVLECAKHGIPVANDFGHTAGIITDSRDTVWQYLTTQTKKLLAATRLIHIGFVYPPYNGTDIHDMLDNPILETRDAVPNKKEIIELLRLFAGRDVWALVEPDRDHSHNYFLARKLLKKAGVWEN